VFVVDDVNESVLIDVFVEVFTPGWTGNFRVPSPPPSAEPVDLPPPVVHVVGVFEVSTFMRRPSAGGI